MNTIGITKETWFNILIATLAVLIFMIVAYWLSIDTARWYVPVLRVIIWIAAAFFLLMLTIGRRLYKIYAYSIINYLDDAKVYKVCVTKKCLEIMFDVDEGWASETLVYKDYGIKVRTRDKYNLPHVMVHNCTVKRITLPLTDKNDPMWQKYEIINL